MNRTQRFFTLCMLAALSLHGMAQEYDITQYYLQNAAFDEKFDYPVGQTGNVDNDQKPIDGWTANHSTTSYAVTGVFQVGTKKTLNGGKIPATNSEGKAEGGVLGLSVGWNNSLIFFQNVSLPAGKYKLVAAYYNGDSKATTGTSLLAWIPSSGTQSKSKVTSFACGEWKEDVVSFTLAATKTGKLQVGFKGGDGVSGNSAKVSVDYVKLLRDTPYGDADIAAYKSNLNSLIKTAEATYGTGEKRGAAALKAAIDKAKEVNDNASATFTEIDAAYEELNQALTVYKALLAADTKLKTVLTSAKNVANKAEEGQATELLQAIEAAQKVYDNADATAEELTDAATALQAAIDTYNFSHPTGAVPTVKTDKRFARGATMAFGRLTVTNNGASIKERGFCWSQSPEPTINDNRSSKTLSGSSVSGTIYWLQDLEPATMYYMRAYAITSGYQVAYGDVIKFCTIPKGTIRLNMRDGGDQATYNRIKQASETAVDYWNNLTEMKGFTPNVGFVDGTPTADCSYGGWIRVGSNSSYQRTGTILHEMLHGVGVIPWADTEWSRHTLRSGVNGEGYGTGQWLGERVTEVVRFLQNSTTAQLNGDYQHLWPYGINGASEDNGEQALYIGNGLVCQALGEDGLQHTYELFAEPYYALDQEDDVKFYIKNESDDRGRFTSFLIPDATGKLEWKTLSAAEAASNDSAAWYVSFTPANQYYQFRNAATGQYMSYASVIKTVAKSTPANSENWHLMKGRVDVDGQRGYWIISPSANWQPKCLQANAKGVTAAATFNIANAAETQRWLIMTLDQMQEADNKAVESMKVQAGNALSEARKLIEVPHTEDTPGTDQTFTNALQNLETQAGTADNTTQLQDIVSAVAKATFEFLQNVSASDASKPFDLSFMMTNPGIDKNTDGWSVSATVNYSCAEFFEKTFDFNQTVSMLPSGNYQLRVQGFQRPGSATAAATANVNATAYAGSKSSKLANITAGGQTAKVGTGTEVLVAGKYVPNNMQAAAAYFKKGYYENTVTTSLTTSGGSMKVGIKSSAMPSNYWVIFDNFRLYYFGKTDPANTDAIKSVEVEGTTDGQPAVYTLDGRRMPTDAQLRPGIYVVGGRKVVVK